MKLAVHCIVKNEENYIWYALTSVVAFADKIIVFDTGSSDKTVSIIKELQVHYPNIIFEEKGECDQKRHTELRQEMIERTMSDWFMILDGDEVWSRRGMEEIMRVMSTEDTECFIAPFYLCVGDVYHYSKKGAYTLRGKVVHATPRLFKNNKGLHWSGSYNHDAICDNEGRKVFEKEKVVFLQEKFWHLSHLRRSSIDDQEYSSGSSRKFKRRLTYFLIGKKIEEKIPEVFEENPGKYVKEMGVLESLKNFILLFPLKISQFFYEKKL